MVRAKACQRRDPEPVGSDPDQVGSRAQTPYWEIQDSEINMAAESGAFSESQRRLLEQWAAHWSAHDLERLLPLFTPDAVYEDVPMGVVNRGTAELRAFGEEVLSRLPDIIFELRSSVADGSTGSAEWIMRGTRDLTGMPATRKRVEVRGVSIFEFAGDKIRRCSDYWDMATYLKQLGLPPGHQPA